MTAGELQSYYVNVLLTRTTCCNKNQEDQQVTFESLEDERQPPI